MFTVPPAGTGREPRLPALLCQNSATVADSEGREDENNKDKNDGDDDIVVRFAASAG